MAEEIITSPEESLSMEAPIAESPIESTEEVVGVKPEPPSKGLQNLQKLHSLLVENDVYSKITPESFYDFVDKYKDPIKMKKLHSLLVENDVYSKIMPADFNEAAKKYGFGGLGKSSAVPSKSVSGGSATKKPGMERPSPLAPTQPSEVEKTMIGYGVDASGEQPKKSPYLSPEELEAGARAEAKLPSEGVSNVERRQQIDENEKKVKRAKYEDQFQAIEQASRDAADQEAGLEQNPAERLKNSLARGSATLLSSLYRSPAFILDMLYVPQNYIADTYDIPSLKATGKEALGFLYDDTNPISLESSAQELDKYVERSQKRFQAKYEESLTTAISNGNYLDAVGILSNQIAESAPVTISLMMGNAAGLSATGTTLAGGVVFGAGKKEELDKNNPNMTEAQKATTAFLSGLTEGFFEQYGISKLGGITKRIFDKSGAEVARKFAEEGFKKMYGKAFFRYLGVSSEEALGETATQFAQNVIDKYSGVKPDLDLSTGLVDAFVGGFGQSTAYSSVPAAITVAKTISGKKKQQEIQQQREELSAIALSEEVPDDASKRAIGEKIKDLNEEEANVVIADNELYNSLSEDGKAKFNTLTNDATQIETTLQNANIPDEVRSILEEKLKSINSELEAIQKPAEEEKAAPALTFAEAIATPEYDFFYRGEQGKLSQEGQTVVFETKNRIYDLENIDELKDKSIDELGIEQLSALDVTLNDDNTLTIEGKKYVNNFSNPEAAINYDDNGNVLSVNLETENGEKRAFRGQRAEEIAYQYKLKSFEQNGTDEQIDNAIEQAGQAVEAERIADEAAPKRKGKSVRQRRKQKGVAQAEAPSLPVAEAPKAPAIEAEPQTLPEVENAVADLREQEKAEEPVAEEVKGEKKEETTLPPEIDSLDDNEFVTIKYESFDEIPESLRDKARKIGGREVKYRKSILGIPVGKEFTSKTKDGYVVTAYGSEIKDAARQTLETKPAPTPEAQAPVVDALKDVDSTAKALEGATNEQWDALTKTTKEVLVNERDASEIYHKAKADGSNPEFVTAVEDLLSNKPQTKEEVTSKIEEPTESKPKATTTKAPSEQTKAERLEALREKARSIKANKPIASAAGAVVKSVKSAINWQKTKEGVKETKISARNPLLTQAAKDLSQGKITNEEYRAIESKSSPILPIENFIEPATESQVANSVDKSKIKNANKPVAPNTLVGLRIDIPAFRNNNVWVVSVHDGSTKNGSIISYKGAARITDVEFGTQSPASSLKIATGEDSKNAQVGRIFGNWNNFDGKTPEEQNQSAKELVEQIQNDPSWVQVGMNPFRHSYFYDRSNDLGRPVKYAKEVVQIGGLVYAKDVVYGNWNDEAYKVKAMLDKAGKPVFFSKKPKANVIATELEIDQEIVDAMNEMELVNEGVDLSPATTKQKTDVKELNERLDTPLKAVKWGEFEGMPFGFTISDQLRSGDTTNPSTDEIVDDLKGGLGFNGTDGNQDKAWANTTEEEAQAMHDKAQKVYNNNKPLFEKLWADGKLPQGVVPFAVVKMAETSILSNEAVFRVGAQNISKLPLENRKAALVVMKQELARKIAKQKADLKRGTKIIEDKKNKTIIDTKEPYSENTKKAKTKEINQYQNILDIIKKDKIRDIVDLLNKDKKFSLPERVLIGKEIFYGNPTPIAGEKVDLTKSRPGTAVSIALVKDSDKSLINIGNITDVLTEPSMKDVPNVHIIAVVGVKVAESKNGKWTEAGGPVETNHPNYPYGVEGQSIGVLSQPIHVKDAFGEAYGSAMSQITENEASNKTLPLNKAVSQGIPVSSGMPNRTFISAIAKTKLDAVDKLSGFLRQAFPGTTFFTSQDAWDAAMQDPAVSKKLKDGDVVYAFTKNGNVFINPNLKTTKATLHEAGHIWMDFMKDSNPELFKKGLSLVEGTQELKDAIDQYGDTELAREEALMEIMSTKGDNIVNAAQKAKVKEWLLSVWKYVSEQFQSLRGLNPQQVEDLSLDKFVEGILADVLSGKEITGKKTKGKTKFSKEEAKSVSEFEKQIEEKYGISLDLLDYNNGNLQLSKIVVPKENRGQGIGEKAMNEIIEYADKVGRRITLTPSTDFGATSVNRLKDFYKQFGFVENTGKNKDFSTRESMYRNPIETKAETKFSKESANDNGANDFVKQSLDEGYTKEEISEILQEEYGKTEAEANELIEQNSPKTSEPNIFDDFDASNKRGGIRSQQEAKKAFTEKHGEDAAIAKAISTNFEAIADELKAKGIFKKINCK
jgi:hypothetical protein